MNVNLLRGIFLSTLLLPLAILPTHSPIAKQEAGASPTGVLAYIQGGDLWVKELPDGQAKRLTTEGGITGPRWSPSGQWLAYLKGDQLWVVQRSGAGAKALEKGGPVSHQFMWSPTWDSLAYRTYSGSLWVASAVDWVEREIVSNPSGIVGRGVLSMAWSPDGERLAYAWQEVLREGQPPDLYAGLWRIRSDGRDAAEIFGGTVIFGTITPGPNPGAIVAVWSPDGQRILFWSDPFSESLLADGTSLNAIPAAGGEPRVLVQYLLAYSDFLDASPDGKFLAITEGGLRDTWSHKRIVVVDLSSGKLTYLTDDNMAALSPVWSPDGRHIAYVAMPDRGDELLAGGEPAHQGLMQRRLWVVNVEGKPQAQQLTDDSAYRDERPLWSADGSYILFARLDLKDGASLWLIPAEGGDPCQVVDELTPTPGWFGYYGHIEWGDYFDWWIGAAPMTLPVTGVNGSVSPEHLLFSIFGILVFLAGLGLLAWQHKAVSPPSVE